PRNLVMQPIVGSARSADTCAAGGSSAQKPSPPDRSSAVAGPAVGPARHAGARLFPPEVGTRQRPRHCHPALRPMRLVRAAPAQAERLALHPRPPSAPDAHHPARQHRLDGSSPPPPRISPPRTATPPVNQ